jgi:hypothetical protein
MVGLYDMHVRKRKNEYRILIGKPEVKGPLLKI